METKRRFNNRTRGIISGSIGNLVEWYDWYAYSSFALYFAPVFFPKSDATLQLLNTAAIFAAGFLMRPLGGWLFGRIADQKGRKSAMTVSVLLMSFGSLIIAVIPSHERIGAAAPVMLLVARLLQGLSVGGEYGTSATYLSEIAPPGRRGFYSSFQYVTLIGGQLLAIGMQLVLQRALLSPEQLQDWGWRIPFVIGSALAFVGLYLRSHMEESLATHDLRKKDERRGSLKELWQKHPMAVLTVIGFTAGGTLAFYTYSVYMQKFLVNTVHLTKDRATLLVFWLLLIYALLQPAFGWLSDKIGRKPLLLFFGFGGLIGTYPILKALSTTASQSQAFLLILLALIIVSGYTSVCAIVKAELFPAEVRALGVGFPYAITVALVGGTAEYAALRFKTAGYEEGFYGYVTLLIGISLLTYLRVKDTRKISRMEEG